MAEAPGLEFPLHLHFDADGPKFRQSAQIDGTWRMLQPASHTGAQLQGNPTIPARMLSGPAACRAT